MLNCGVIGFNNPQLKQEYFDTYNNMVKQYAQTGLNVEGSVPDIIIEQQFLKDLTDYKDYKVKCVLPVNSAISLQSYAASIGYQHVIGGSKQINLEKVLNTIKMFDKTIYDDLIKIKWKLNIK